jgi:hypothetical protein
LKLYDTRREAAMRKARQWFIGFSPNSVDDIFDTLRSENSANYRMVTSYWDMAATFVNHGAIEESMFNAVNGEHVIVFAKVEPFVGEYRTRMGQPHYLQNLEQLVRRLPDASARLVTTRERFRPAPTKAG